MIKQDERKILLIEPPFYRLFKDSYSLCRYPLSLGYLAGMIKKKTDWEVRTYNADFSPQNELMKVSYLATAGFDNYLNNLKDLSVAVWKEVKSTIVEYNPAIVGISSKSQNFASARIVAKLAKEINKQITVIMGGPHPTMVGADILNYPEIDICAKGEGENTIVELLDAIENEKKFDSIEGIIYRKGERIVENPHRKFINDLDSLCFPHENAPEVLIDYDLYPLVAFKNIFATRGCPYNCFFCGSRKIWSRKVRFRSPQNVIEEIKRLQKKGLEVVHFDDDTFGITKQYISKLCNVITTHCPGLKWSCELHVKLVDEKVISLMKAAGCFLIQIGIESGNNEILKEIRKNITIEEAFSACEIIKKHGIDLQTFFMVGFPQETEETLKDTATAMKKINCDAITYSVFTPYPNTDAFEFCKQKGLIGDDYDASLYNHQSPVNCFCFNIPPERFRILVSKIEKMVDRKNTLNSIKRVFSLRTFNKIQRLGMGESLKRGIRVFFGK